MLGGSARHLHSADKDFLFGAIFQKLILIHHQIIRFSRVWIAYTRQIWTRRGGESEADPGPAQPGAFLPV